MLWVKSFHVIFMVMWFAALFYLPRLFVYHAMSDDRPSHDRFLVMERKLFVIMTIGGIGTAIFGLWMLWAYALTTYAGMGWLHTKLALVALLIGYHVYCYKLMRDFRLERNIRSHKFYRMINELPVLILFGVVILVIVKPF